MLLILHILLIPSPMIMCAKNLQLISTASNPQQPKNKPSKYGRSSCGEYTTNDMEGPFFEVGVYILCHQKNCAQPFAPKNHTLAQDEELKDRTKAVILKGQVNFWLLW